MSGYVLGVDLGGTKIAVLGSDKIPQDPSVSVSQWDKAGLEAGIMRVPSLLKDYSVPIEERLAAAVEKYVQEYENGVMPDMIGFGLKDHVDRRNGIWYAHPTAHGREPLDMAKFAQERLGVRAVLDNDVHTATEGEVIFGAGRKYEDFLYINIGTGIAMGAVIEGRILGGAANYAGEIGHMSVDPRGALCTFCGQRGCYEDIACGEAIINQARAAMEKNPGSMLAETYEKKQFITSHDVFMAADAGDADAREIADRVYEAVLISTCGLINVFNPEAVIYGGGVMSDGWLINKLNQDVPSHVIATDRDSLKEISLSELGSDHVGVLGAVALAVKGK